MMAQAWRSNGDRAWRDEPRDNRDLAGNLSAGHILGRIRQTSEDSAGTMVMWRSTWMAGIDPRVCYPGDPAPHGRYGVSGRNLCSPGNVVPARLSSTPFRPSRKRSLQKLVDVARRNDSNQPAIV